MAATSPLGNWIIVGWLSARVSPTMSWMAQSGSKSQVGEDSQEDRDRKTMVCSPPDIVTEVHQIQKWLDSYTCVWRILNWWNGNPSGSIACTRKQQPRFYWSCSSVVMNDATPLSRTPFSNVNNIHVHSMIPEDQNNMTTQRCSTWRLSLLGPQEE